MIITFNDVERAVIASLSLPVGVGFQLLSANPESSYCPYYRFLYHWVSVHKPDVALECGVYLGTASEHMALANDGTYVIGVDKELRDNMEAIWRRHDNIAYVISDTTSIGTLNTVIRLMEKNAKRSVGLLFLDSNHDGVTPKAEFELYRQLFDDYTLVVCDDIDCNQEMKDFWNWLPGDKIRLDYLHPKLHAWYPETGFGVSIVRSNGS
jgi:hypothetical protein